MFWIGLALPLPWVIVARVALLALAWKSLTWSPGRSGLPHAQEAAPR